MSRLKTVLQIGLFASKFYHVLAVVNHIRKTIEDLAEGKVDIVIGTHKILQEECPV